MNIDDNRFLFSYETGNSKYGKVRVREVKILDQFGRSFDKSINSFNTPKSICGYMVSAVAPLIAQSTSYVCQISDIEGLLKKLNDPKVVVPEVEKCMEIIQGQRTQYIKEFANEFSNKKEKDKYMTDWVATYEIGDLMEILNCQVENLFFLRYVSFQFPDLLKDVKHEEKRRLAQEEKYKKERFIIESYSGNKKLQNLDEWVTQGSGSLLNSCDKSLVFIGDMLGHYITFFACKVLREDGELEDTVFLVNSISANYLHFQEIICTACELAFPESVPANQNKAK